MFTRLYVESCYHLDLISSSQARAFRERGAISWQVSLINLPFIPRHTEFVGPLLGPRYNIAPRAYSPVLRCQGSELILQSMRWGVVPRYSKHEDKYLISNARGEHLTNGTSSLWNGLRGKKRCVVPVQGYYEWLKKSNTERIPHFTKHKGQKIMLLAGLWDVVTLEGSYTHSKLVIAYSVANGSVRRFTGTVIYVCNCDNRRIQTVVVLT